MSQILLVSIKNSSLLSAEIKFFADNFLKLFDKIGSLMGLFNESKSDFIMELNLLLLKSKSINY